MSGPGRTGPGPGLNGKRVTVMGLGLFGGGAGAARWALREGALVTVTDLRDESLLAGEVAALRGLDARTTPRFVLGRHEAADFTQADVVIVNPAVPATSPLLALARASGASVTTATALLLERLRARTLAITGTHGKSSTARFTRDLLVAALPGDARVRLGGNIGGSLLDEVNALTARDVVVLELSSYQLEHLPEGTRELVDAAVLTNVGVDHLERHGTVDAYCEAKLRILDLVRADGTALVPVGPLSVRATARLGRPCTTHGDGGDVSIDEHLVVRREAEQKIALGDVRDLEVPGDFQRGNLAVALAAAHALGADPARLRRAVSSLRGLPHRMESLGTLEIPRARRPVEVVDNGVSTTPESTLAAVESITAAGRRVLVAGGQAKRGVDDLALARRLAADDDWTLVPFGAAADHLTAIAREAGARVADGPPLDTAEEAARAALDVAADEDAALVLFSPACASFDRYPNFETRALAFREAIRAVTRRIEPTEPTEATEATEAG